MALAAGVSTLAVSYTLEVVMKIAASPVIPDILTALVF